MKLNEIVDDKALTDAAIRVVNGVDIKTVASENDPKKAKRLFPGLKL